MRACTITLLVAFGFALAAAASDDLDKQVAKLIDEMTDPDSQMIAFAKLEAMGCTAVPSVIPRMDDRRKLPRAGISLENRATDAFEGVRHYSPDVVVDALAAILNQITGEHFGFIYNGASEEERDATIKGWKRYLDRVGPKNICTDCCPVSLDHNASILMSLDYLKLVGITESGETKIAIVEDDQGEIYRLKNRDFIGENDGMIVSINVTDITIIQLVQDENGFWKEKYVTFAME